MEYNNRDSYIYGYDWLPNEETLKKLVPEIMIPFSVLENIVCKDAAPVMGLIQLNTVLLQKTWRILRYSSVKSEEFPESQVRIEL